MIDWPRDRKGLIIYLHHRINKIYTCSLKKAKGPLETAPSQEALLYAMNRLVGAVLIIDKVLYKLHGIANSL